MDKDVGSLEEKAAERKNKLRNLKRKKDESSEPNNQESGRESLPKPTFRSYKPEDSKLQENLLPTAEPSNITEEIKDQLEAATSKAVIDELDITNLAPRKPDWDLKRDVAKKLEKLERRTQRAIAELIRERLKQRKQNLALEVNGAEIVDAVPDN